MTTCASSTPTTIIASATPGRLRRHAWEIALLTALAAIGWFLFQRNHGLYPSIFADEWYYSKMARLEPFDGALVPSWLYLWLARALSAAGGAHFLEAIRLGNLALLLGAAPLLYATARRFAAKPFAFAIAVGSTLAPLNLYTAYFMPEATYYFGFCLLSWTVLTRQRWRWAPRAMAAGAIVGAMSLVKVHALFLLPGLCLFLAYALWIQGADVRGPVRMRAARALGVAALAAACALVVKFGLGWLIAGEAGLHLFGQFYGRAASTATGSAFDLLRPALTSGKAHLATLALLSALPLAVTAHQVWTRVLRRTAYHAGSGSGAVTGAGAGDPGLLALYVLLMLGAAAGLTVLYTASLEFLGRDELMRVHLRYYSFAFPLLWLVAAGSADTRAPMLRWALALGLCALLWQAMTTLPDYRLLMVDGPDIVSIDLAHPAAKALALLQGALLLGWAAGRRAARPLFVFVALPATLVAGQVRIGAELRLQQHPSAADLGGQAALRLTPRPERGAIVVAGDNPQFVMRAQFQIDEPGSRALMLPQGGGALGDDLLPAEAGWLLMLSPNPLPPRARLVASGDGYRLLEFGARKTGLDGREVGRIALDDTFGTAPDALLERIEGFSHGEPWGRWSIGKQVTLHFGRALPRHAGIVLEGQSYGVNATLPFVARAGQAQTTFRIGGTRQRVVLRLDTDGVARSLVIEVPQPQSPAELGNPADARPLGIGLARIAIIDLDLAPALP